MPTLGRPQVSRVAVAAIFAICLLAMRMYANQIPDVAFVVVPPILAAVVGFVIDRWSVGIAVALSVWTVASYRPGMFDGESLVLMVLMFWPLLAATSTLGWIARQAISSHSRVPVEPE